MEKLSKLGRQVICDRIGIKDKNSIFIKSTEAFNDRMNLLNIMYGIDNLINTYCTELKEFKSEEEYVAFLDSSEEMMYSKLEEYIILADNIEREFDNYVNISIPTINNYNTDNSNKYIMHIYFDSPIYSSIEYLVRLHTTLPSNFGQFVLESTGSKFLATNKDLKLEKFSSETQKIIIRAMKIVSASILSVISPKYINIKELINADLAEIKYVTSDKRSTESLYTIANSIRNNEALKFKSICIDVYKEKPIFVNSNMVLRSSIYSKYDNIYNIHNYKTLELLRYLRSEYSEELSKYDNYFEVNGHEAKLLSDIELTRVS